MLQLHSWRGPASQRQQTRKFHMTPRPLRLGAAAERPHISSVASRSEREKANRRLRKEQLWATDARPVSMASSQNGTESLVSRATAEKQQVWSNGSSLAPDWDSGFSIPQQLYHRAKSVPLVPNRLRIFAGTANSGLAAEVACYLGLDLSPIKIKRFADGEIYVAVEESIRGCDVFLVQPTCPPVNDHLMELCVTIDACKRASARSITAVVPYFGYARADRKTQGRESIAAKLVANLITEAGADRLLAMDLHSGQCVGYFDIPVDHVYGDSVLLDYLASKRISTGDLVVVSPDVGGVARARAFAKKLNDAPLAIVDKRRSAHNVSEVMNLIGDVRDKVAVLVDDMIDTAGTIANAAKVLNSSGAREIYVCATHAVFSPPAIERLSSGIFQEVIVTNTIPTHPDRMFPELTVLSVANLLGETIWRVYNSSSVQSLL